MSFADIRDQDVPVKLLRNTIERGRIPHGLLFWGPGGVGKRLAAVEMAKAVMCQDPGRDACDTCLSCRKVVSGNHPDLAVVAPRKKSRIIDVETVETINELASLRPYESAWRVFIIQDADRMGIPAQNHLLKTLEEPPGRSLFMLITELPGALLPTTRSRCQRLRFGTLAPETVKALLQRERPEVSPARAEAIASLAQGQMSRALDLVDSDKRDVVLNVAQRLNQGDDPLDVAEEFAKYLEQQKQAIENGVKDLMVEPDKKEASREDIEEYKREMSALVEALTRRDIMEHLYLFETWYRDELVFRATGDVSRILNKDQKARLEAVREGDSESKIAAIEKARRYLERFLNEERVFRDLFFALAG